MFIVRPTKFAMLYTLGNLLSMGSTMFLVGPVKQIGEWPACDALGFCRKAGSSFLPCRQHV